MLVSAPTGAKPAQEDSGHWYTRDGAPAYRQVTRAGGFRGTDIRDAKRLGLTPSVTTVLSLLAKPALTNWMVDQGILAALTLPRAPGEPEEAFLRRVKEDSRAQGKAAAEEGSRIHDACEMSMKGREFPPRYIQHVLGASNKLRELFPNVTDWIAEQSFAHESGYGGKVDLHSPSTGIVVDYKTTDEREGVRKAVSLGSELAAGCVSNRPESAAGTLRQHLCFPQPTRRSVRPCLDGKRSGPRAGSVRRHACDMEGNQGLG